MPQTIDRKLHAARISRRREKVTFRSRLKDLPTGTIIAGEDQPILLWHGAFLRWSFSGYQGADKRAESAEVDVVWHVAMKRGQRRALTASRVDRLRDATETAKAKVRARGEHAFHVVKNLFGHRKVRYRGIDKNEAQLFIDIKYLLQMADESHRRYVFLAIDRAPRFVYIAFKADKSASAARSFLRELHQACPVRIQKVLTDNGKEFTNRLFGRRQRDASGDHEFDRLCTALGIEHRLTRPCSPQTNGMVERFNGRLAEVIASHHFRSAEDLETTIKRYVWLYNQHIGQKALSHRTPVQAMKDWYAERPDLFRKKPRNLRGPDN